ncbi:hypothetical protein ACHAWF_002729, partial [Thalassiosira exigua]
SGAGAGAGDGRAASDDRDDAGLLGDERGSDRGGGAGGREEGTRARRAAGFAAMDATYRDAVLAELDAISRCSREPEIRWGSVYFGGGTPSLAPLETLRGVMRRIKGEGEGCDGHEKCTSGEGAGGSSFRLEDDAEVTIEMDPGTFDRPYLESVKDMGFNRISLGVQSFDDDVLANMGRVHRAADVRRSVELIREVFGGDANYSVDLISGAPGLTLANWSEALREAVGLRPPPAHLSLYDLQVEEDTAFGRWYDVGDEDEDEGGAGAVPDAIVDPGPSSSSLRPALPSASDRAFMYSYASGYLRSRGYEHYEISSYALRDDGGNRNNDGDGSGGASPRPSRRRSRHNGTYWAYDGRWHAVGLGATSRADGRAKHARPRALADYVSWAQGLGRFPAEGEPPWLRGEDLDDDNEDDEKDNDSLLDVVMTRLRTSDGLDLDWVLRREGGHMGEASVEAILNGFADALEWDLGIWERDPGGRSGRGLIRLKDPAGFLFSNFIISNIFAELSDLGP